MAELIQVMLNVYEQEHQDMSKLIAVFGISGPSIVRHRDYYQNFSV